MSDIATIAIILLLCMTAWYFIAVIIKRNDIADIAWGFGFPLMAWSAYILSSNPPPVAVVVNIMITIWGIRLSWHIARRNTNKPEDFRYAKWRKNWKYFYLRSYLQIFVLQGVFLYIVVLPTLLLNISHSNTVIEIVMLGVLIWLVGLYFEVVGDSQLATFVANPKNKGKIMQSGLWRFTRHPNYFGESTIWWGIFIITISTISIWPAIIGPITITFLLIFVSGIPMLEKKYENNIEYIQYKKITSVFIPLPPKKNTK